MMGGMDVSIMWTQEALLRHVTSRHTVRQKNIYLYQKCFNGYKWIGCETLPVHITEHNKQTEPVI
jgi:hypothetical protein